MSRVKLAPISSNPEPAAESVAHRRGDHRQHDNLAQRFWAKRTTSRQITQNTSIE